MVEPKQDRAVKTREAILHAAAEVFDTYGYSGASISKIMERAQVTQGGMYFHFKSKLGLARAVLEHQQEFVHFPPTGHDGLQLLIDLNFFLARELQTNVVFRASVRLAVEQGDFGMRDDTAYQEWVEQFYGLLCAARERGSCCRGSTSGSSPTFWSVPTAVSRCSRTLPPGVPTFSRASPRCGVTCCRMIGTPQAIAELRFPQDVQKFAA